ncbi:MAG: glycosyltransferase family 4 protein [Pseudomonadales bacterium]|nr:glycosyltransferase family 4 protein [Pseudomonadales bacterium]MBO6596128.1 glycosyltransferase family 4 protein [Pseudomonadales bacterium]MBO6822610.1 glycosyltransferase family 4 protein [Pseudomonadales bacterium]
MKIAVDARPLSYPLTGIGRYTHSLLQQLTKSEHDWYLYSDRPLLSELPEAQNVNIRVGNAQGGTPGSLRWAQWQYVKWARSDGIDVFWSPRHHLPLILPKKTRSVVTIHDLVWRRYPETMQRKNFWLEKLLMGPSIRKANKLIAVSQFTASEISTFYPDAQAKTTVIYEAANETNANATLARELPDDFFLFVGTLEPRKNLERLLESCAQVLEPNMPLVIAGAQGWGEVQLQKLLVRFDLANRVICLGYINDEMLDTLYANANALIMPSVYEGFGLPVVEALKYGVPCIVSKGTSLEEVAGEAAILVNPYSVSEISKAITNIQKPEVHSSLAKHAIDRSLAFSWAKAANQTLSVLTD